MFLFYHNYDKLKSTMMDTTDFLKKLNGAAAVMCVRDADTGDLVRGVEAAIESAARFISVDASAVDTVWPWLENTGVEIVARFTCPTDDTWDARISDLAGRVSCAFKRGAVGAQIFMRTAQLDGFADALRPIRDDLFFNRTLSVALDLGECDYTSLPQIWDSLARVRADSLLLTLTRDAGDKSDFVGRVYSMLETRGTWHGDLHFALGANMTRIEQVQRLVAAMQKERLAKILFFVNN